MDLFSGTSIKRWAKGLAKFVRFSDEVSLYQGSFHIFHNCWVKKIVPYIENFVISCNNTGPLCQERHISPDFYRYLSKQSQGIPLSL